MKYFLALLIGCAPLAGLTTWSVVEAVTSSAQASSDDPEVKLDDIGKDLKTAAQEKEPSIEELAADNPLEALRPDPPEALGDALATRWDAAQRARRFLLRLVDAKLNDVGKIPTTPAELNAVLSRLQRFLEDPQSNNPPAGAEELIARFKVYRDDLQAAIDRRSRHDRIAAALKDAQDQFERRDYAGCLATLDKEPLADGAQLEERTAKDVSTLRRRAEFCDQWKRVGWARTSRLDASSAKSKRGEISGFLERFPRPPTSAENDIVQDAHDALDLLDARLRILNLLADLDQGSVDDLTSLVERAIAVLSSSDAQEYEKTKVRHKLKEWIRVNAFPKIAAPDSLKGKKEAVTAAGTRKLGIFRLPVSGATQYYFWSDAKHQASPAYRKGDEAPISVSALVQPPSTPQYLVWAKDYSDQVDGLLEGRTTTKDDWEHFAAQCDRWQNDVVAYREKWGVSDEPDRSCRDWSFKRAAQTARQITRHWNEFQKVLNQY